MGRREEESKGEHETAVGVIELQTGGKAETGKPVESIGLTCHMALRDEDHRFMTCTVHGTNEMREGFVFRD